MLYFLGIKKGLLMISGNKIHFTSLGCARNLVDTEVMIGILLKSGYEAVNECEKADYLVINTCGFLEASREEALDVIYELDQVKKKGAKLIVCGCMVQKHKDLLVDEFPDIFAFLGSGDVDKILEVIESENASSVITSAKSYIEMGEVPRIRTTPKHYAFVKIAEGCKKRCAFCIIPNIKGALQSKTTEQVLQEINILLKDGVFEIILIAQDLGDFGKDRKEKDGLTDLLKEILKIEKPFWLRLLYLYPDEITDELIQVMKSDARICPYLDMPIQHINDRILKRMHRKTSAEQIKGILQTLRTEIPNVVIRTSLMVGFPGETEEEFNELVEFVKEAKLNNIGIFTYSKEKESYSASYADQLDEDTKVRRKEILAKVQQEVVFENNKKYLGQKLSVIVEGYHEESEYLMVGRFVGQAPDIDGRIILNDTMAVTEFSKLYEVEVTDVMEYDLLGRVLAPVELKSDTLQLV